MAEAKPPQAQGTGDQDPSMEEILQSIRRIIAEDDKKDELPAEPNGALGSDVLELTEMVQEDGSLVSLAAADPAGMAGEAAPSLDVLVNIDSALSEELLSQEIPASPTPPPPPTTESQLLSPQAAASASASLKKIPQTRPEAPAVPTTPSMPFRSGITVEDLAREALRPMLKEWLDANLPAIIERIVEREIKKLRDM